MATTAERIREAAPVVPHGAVAGVNGAEVDIRGLRVRTGDALTLHARDGDRPAEVVSVTPEIARAAVLGRTAGLARGDRVSVRRRPPTIRVGPSLVGRIIDPLGNPLDDKGPVDGTSVGMVAPTPSALARKRVTERLATGVRTIDTLTPLGRGQRVGIIAGSGVGKSTLLGMITRQTSAEVTVVGLIGERGREVREFVEDSLGAEGLARSVVVVATADQPALLRLRAGSVTTRIAEHFADEGADALLLVDSLTRLAMARRDVGLAAGELPTSRGYPPSVAGEMLPTLLERAGPRANGTVTGMYTVLTEGDDTNDPVADSARSILDGHLVLDRTLANAGRYPPIDPLQSLSRLAGTVTDEEEERARATVRRLIAAYEDVRELVEVGAYISGSNPHADAALALRSEWEAFLRQAPDEICSPDDAKSALKNLAQRVESQLQ